MGVKTKFDFAAQFILRLKPEHDEELAAICARIQHDQQVLLAQSEPLMRYCIEHCQGLCCRNLLLDAIITISDCVYVLTVNDNMRPDIVQRLEQEDRLFAADCIFLDHGRGPCIIPADCRPMVCAVTFCQDETLVKPEIRRLRASFSRLRRFMARSGWKTLLFLPWLQRR